MALEAQPPGINRRRWLLAGISATSLRAWGAAGLSATWDGDNLHVAAPQLHFLAGKPLERLKDGLSIEQATAGARVRRERFPAAPLESPRRQQLHSGMRRQQSPSRQSTDTGDGTDKPSRDSKKKRKGDDSGDDSRTGFGGK